MTKPKSFSLSRVLIPSSIYCIATRQNMSIELTKLRTLVWIWPEANSSNGNDRARYGTEKRYSYIKQAYTFSDYGHAEQSPNLLSKCRRSPIVHLKRVV